MNDKPDDRDGAIPPGRLEKEIIVGSSKLEEFVET